MHNNIVKYYTICAYTSINVATNLFISAYSVEDTRSIFLLVTALSSYKKNENLSQIQETNITALGRKMIQIITCFVQNQLRRGTVTFSDYQFQELRDV